MSSLESLFRKFKFQEGGRVKADFFNRYTSSNHTKHGTIVSRALQDKRGQISELYDIRWDNTKEVTVGFSGARLLPSEVPDTSETHSFMIDIYKPYQRR